MGGRLVDLKGFEIPNEDAGKYYAVLDGQHRLEAYQNLQLDLNDLVICEPLNAELSITEVIAQMNICTTVWKKSDYMAAPAMMLKEANEVFDFAMFLHSKACPLSTISLWCFGRKSLQAKDLVECLNTKKLPEIFEDKTWFRSSIRWFKAAQGKFKDKFLMNRYLIDFITKQWKPDEWEVKINSIELLPEVKDRLVEKLTVTAPLSAINDEMIVELGSMVKESPGNTELYFFIRDEDGQMFVNLMSHTLKISVQKNLVNYLKSQPLLDYKIN